MDGLTAAILIGQRTRALRRARIPVQRLGAAEWVEVFDLVATGRIPLDAVLAVATRMANDGLNAETACAAAGVALVDRAVWQRAADAVTLDG